MGLETGLLAARLYLQVTLAAAGLSGDSRAGRQDPAGYGMLTTCRMRLWFSGVSVGEVSSRRYEDEGAGQHGKSTRQEREWAGLRERVGRLEEIFGVFGWYLVAAARRVGGPP